MPDRFLVSTQRLRCVETKKRQRQEAPADFSVGAVESVMNVGSLLRLQHDSGCRSLESYNKGC